MKNDLVAVLVRFENELMSSYLDGILFPRGEIDMEFELIYNWLLYKVLCRWRRNIERSLWDYLYLSKHQI